MCDDVFDKDNFLNEITWSYRRWPVKHKKYQRMHDVILWYTKTKKYIWNQLYEPLSDVTIQSRGDVKVDSGFDEYGKRRPMKKTQEKSKGMPLRDVWDISFIAPISKERIGYKTQKPEALLKRILQASSNEGNIVLDCFAGGGTTAKICADLDRVFICGDVSPVAVRVIASRLNKYCPKVDYQIQGLPKTEKELKAINGHHFATLVCRCKGWDVNTKKVMMKE